MRMHAHSVWAATTLAAIAAEADIAVETIYSGSPPRRPPPAGGDGRGHRPATPSPSPHGPRNASRTCGIRPPRQNDYASASRYWRTSTPGPVTDVWAATLEAAASDLEEARWCREHENRRRSTTARTNEQQTLRNSQPYSDCCIRATWKPRRGTWGWVPGSTPFSCAGNECGGADLHGGISYRTNRGRLRLKTRDHRTIGLASEIAITDHDKWPSLKVVQVEARKCARHQLISHTEALPSIHLHRV